MDNLHIILLVTGAIVLHCSCLLRLRSEAAPLTDSIEIQALKTIAQKLGKKDWDFNVDPCSGKSWITQESQQSLLQNNVTCNCSFNNGTVCHVTNIILKRQNLSGVIPPELANLTYLQEIDLFLNNLTGSIPATLGSLTSLQKLSLGMNNLSGQIPKELGNLSNLRSLVVLSNQLSGELPQDLGNLTKLNELHIATNQFSGEMPTTLAKLTNLRDFRASSNNFTGKIPSFIGSWRNLNTLMLQGTNLHGPIPSIIYNLYNINDLRISDLIQGSSYFPPTWNLTNVKKLLLRNNMISGKIPDGELNYLEILEMVEENKVFL